MMYRPRGLVVWMGLLHMLLAVSVYGVATMDPQVRGTAYIVLHGMLCLTMVLAWWGGAQWMTVIWGAALASRVILVGVEPFTTHDVDRYLWDGAVLLEGLDPYQIRPADPVVASLRAHWPSPPEHADYPTLYPPLAVALFAGCAAAGPAWGLWLWKALVAIASMALLVPVWNALRHLRAERHFSLVALNPLLVLEGGVGAHVDILVAWAIAVALLAGLRRQGLRMGWAVAAAGLLKLAGVAVLLAMTRRGSWGFRLRIGMAWLLGLGLGYGGAFSLGLRPLGSLPVFLEVWRFGSPLFWALEELFEENALAVAGALVGLGALGVAVRSHRDALGVSAVFALALPWLFSPVVFPWYLASLVPPMTLAPAAWAWGWLVAAPLTYEVVNVFESTGLWQPARWPVAVITLGWLGGAAWDLWRFWRPPRITLGQRRPPDSEPVPVDPRGGAW